MRVVAVFIAYKAAGTLEEFWRGFPKELFDECILVDDVSGDGTFELAEKLGIQSYENEINLGYGGNLKRALGIALAHGADVIVDIHPDNEYSPSAIPAALDAVRGGADFVLGNRFASKRKLLQSGMRLYKFIVLWFLTTLDRFMFRVRIGDFHQGFRVYTRKLLETVRWQANANNFLFSFQIIAQAAYCKLAFAQVPVETRYEGEKRGATMRHSIRYTWGTCKVRFAYIAAKLGLWKSSYLPL